eukprot:TRINITY_DN31923_c0_g1_i1.p1 TRINITY_DN31923_c0_g1~~TRINITY_DN31923_c0_g1_i1.p1  ORF type:complete len:121 (-),score=21.80 TRINITY_DN31923_c0_g1_i1:136-498(-)
MCIRDRYQRRVRGLCTLLSSTVPRFYKMSSSSGTAPKVTLHKIYPIGFYTAESAGSICSICKLTLEEQCPTCAANPRDEDCVSTANESCGHRLHVHCIEGWLRKTTKCPVCDHEWNAPVM